MEWVHCNSCFTQPCPEKKDVSFSLTACGHIFCNHCQRKDFCSLCEKTCSVVILSNGLINDVKIYFTNPVSLLEKSILEIDRVHTFQKSQRERLFNHKKNEMKKKSQILLNDIQILEKEVMELEKQLKSESTPVEHEPSSHSQTSCQLKPSHTSQNSFQPDLFRSSSGQSNSKSIHSPQGNHQAPFQPTSYSQTRHSQSSNSPNDHPRLSPMNMKNKILMYGQQKNQSDTFSGPSAVQSSSPQNVKRPRIVSESSRPNRLSVRTPPMDGKIGSSEGSLRSNLISPIGNIVPSRISPASGEKQKMYTPGSNSLIGNHGIGRSVFPRSDTPDSTVRSFLNPVSLQVRKTPNTGANSSSLFINSRKTLQK